MKKIIAALSVLAFVGAASGCSSERHTKTTTRETFETAPVEPVVIEKRTTTHTETRSDD